MEGSVNPHSSMTAYEITEKDLNKRHVFKNRKDKNELVVATWKKYAGQLLHAVNLQTGVVRIMEVPPPGTIKARMGRVNIIHLLFGDWRMATPEDIARQDAINKAKARQMAEKDARRMATASGLVMTEMASAASAITAFNNMANREEKETAKAKR